MRRILAAAICVAALAASQAQSQQSLDAVTQSYLAYRNTIERGDLAAALAASEAREAHTSRISRRRQAR